MLQRAGLLLLAFWLIAFSALSAHAGPCDMEKMPAQIAAETSEHAHCDMMAAPDTTNPDAPASQADDGLCCCPVILAALPFAPAPEAASVTFRPPAVFPLEIRAPSRNLIPEPPPPKA